MNNIKKRILTLLLSFLMAFALLMPVSAVLAADRVTVTLAIADLDKTAATPKWKQASIVRSVQVDKANPTVKEVMDKAKADGAINFTGTDDPVYGFGLSTMDGLSLEAGYYPGYSVNDVYASLGYSSMVVKNGDKIVFFVGHPIEWETAPKWADVVKTNQVSSFIAPIVNSYANLKYSGSGSDWIAMDMAAAGAADKAFPTAEAKKLFASASISKIDTAKVTDYARVALTITSLGYDASELIAAIAQKGTSDINAMVFGLQAYDSANYAVPEGASNTRDKFISGIIVAQHNDGSWGWSDSPEPSMTAMAITALAKYKDQSAVASAIDKALVYLSGAQDSSGGFVSYGYANSNDAAMVIIALSALGIDADADSRFVKSGGSVVSSLLSFVTSSGMIGYDSSASADAFATEQGLRALVAYNKFDGSPANVYSFKSDASSLEKLTPDQGWVDTPDGWLYLADGVAQTGWLNDGGKYYYLDPETGIMKTGWIVVEGKDYYLDNTGAMATGWQRAGSKWYEFNSKGEWIEGSASSGWKQYSKGWCFAVGNTWATGWKMIEGSWYYFDNAMYMQTGWEKVGSAWYYLNGGGDMVTGWKNISGKWYYLRASGAMQTGWLAEGANNDVWYYLKDSGAMAVGWENVKGSWYYMLNSGRMATGWQQLGGNWYYLHPTSGKMVTGTQTIDGKTYSFNTNGAWIG